MGASRETVHRLLGEPRDRGVVRIGRRSLEILRPGLLRAVAGTERDG
ncbi:helix-turn-helix domain-containing protein [Streptomyces sp. enrichment culture]